MKKNILGLFLLISIFSFSFNSVEQIRTKNNELSKNNPFKFKGENKGKRAFSYSWNTVDANVFYQGNQVTKVEIKGNYIAEQNSGKIFEKFLRELSKIINIRRLDEIINKSELMEDYLYNSTDKKQEYLAETADYRVKLTTRRNLGEFFLGATWDSRRTKDKNVLIIEITKK
ncbi:MAG: hypothetical protein Q4D53_07605 [Leptotrichiaceae bacterium]|nr:hypothetical protein [Leptotrichiaceae bacterium]